MRVASSDLSLSFLIEAGSIRGRLVRLGPALEAILAGHDYPAAVAERLAETVVLAASLAGALKYEGVFTLQVQAKGAIGLMVADVTSDGDLRAYARFDADRLAQAEARADLAPVPRYLESGFLAFTVDQGADTDRYQGIVELSGDTLAASAEAYFAKSEQIETRLMVATAPGAGRPVQAAALAIQRMPTGPTSPILTADKAEEDWSRATILTASLRDDELLDGTLAPADLLHRLYHAEGLMVHEPRALAARCRCSRQRVETTLRSFPRAEIESLKTEGVVSVVCEFCKTEYRFGDRDLDILYG